MSGIATAMVVGSVATGYMSSQAQEDAASQAADAQGSADRAALAEQQRQFDTVMQTLQPFVDAGKFALYGMPEGGLSEQEMYGSRNPFANEVMGMTQSDISSEIQKIATEGGDPKYLEALKAVRAGQDPTGYSSEPTAFGGEGSVGGAGAGGLFGFAQAGEEALPVMQQFAQTGSDALGAQRALAGLDGAEAQAQAIEMLKGTPEYDYLVGQAEEALLQNASATGGVRGGRTQSALMETRPAILTDMINRKYAQYGGLAGQGGTAASSLVSGGQNAFQNIFSAGQASAGGQAGAAQAAGANAANLMQAGGTNQANALLAGGAARANAYGGVGDSINTLGTLKLAGII